MAMNQVQAQFEQDLIKAFAKVNLTSDSDEDFGAFDVREAVKTTIPGLEKDRDALLAKYKATPKSDVNYKRNEMIYVNAERAVQSTKRRTMHNWFEDGERKYKPTRVLDFTWDKQWERNKENFFNEVKDLVWPVEVNVIETDAFAGVPLRRSEGLLRGKEVEEMISNGAHRDLNKFDFIAQKQEVGRIVVTKIVLQRWTTMWLFM